jgi:hypothetical protein
VENLQHELASRGGRSNSLIAGARILSAPSPRGASAGPGIGSATLSIAVPPRPKSNYEKSPLKSIHKSPKLSQGHAFTSSTPSRRSSSAPFSPTGGGGGGGGGGHDGASDLMKFTSTIDHMDKQLAELKYLFRPMDPLLERSHSVIKIQAVVRRWIAQRKYQKYWMSLSSWCLGRAQTYLPVIEQGLYRSSRINSTIQSIHIKKSSILLKSIFDRWIHICKQSAPFRRSMIVAAEERYRAKIFRFKLEVPFFSPCLSPCPCLCVSVSLDLSLTQTFFCSIFSPSKMALWAQTLTNNCAKSIVFLSRESVTIFN